MVNANDANKQLMFEGKSIDMFVPYVNICIQGRIYKVYKLSLADLMSGEFFVDELGAPLSEVFTEMDMFRFAYRISPVNPDDKSAEACAQKAQQAQEYLNCLNKWFEKLVKNSKGEPMSVEKCVEYGWTAEDFLVCLRQMAKASG